MRILLALLACLVSGAARSDEPPAGEKPLQAGVAESPPFIIGGQGHLSGFTIDLFRAIAAHMKRSIVFVPASQADLPRLLADGRLDLLAGPIAATPERAAEMLFTEGYMWSSYQFGTQPGHRLEDLKSLHAHTLAVQTGSDYAEWAERNATKFGFTVQPYPQTAAVLDAVRTGKAEASLTDSAALRFAAFRHPGLVPGLILEETRTHDSAAFRPADAELRDEVEDTLSCLKQDGTVAKLSKHWFGTDPDSEDLEKLVVPGYGVPGLAGYDQKTHKTHC